MKTDPSILAKRPVSWKWCSRCNCAFDFGRASRHTYDMILTSCPSCGSGMESWRAWEEIRRQNPECPEVPTEGAMYSPYPRQVVKLVPEKARAAVEPRTRARRKIPKSVAKTPTRKTRITKTKRNR